MLNLVHTMVSGDFKKEDIAAALLFQTVQDCVQNLVQLVSPCFVSVFIFDNYEGLYWMRACVFVAR